ncbi:aminoglycoside phosphotransferase family protein [Kibdelosporangium philippinense]|uniref:Aminoglycoside phosphotransferase family protein n=1 Tax=Kibdelosporangium philippinense TaxID=211113 RepID=A0ABS8Z3B9_9PSEU|nr:phosphotransferase [Kibdelosporangium philippinense]MCE7001967.1 aminoglycoside phosphotransferase family protein [Kibdelosporangium philippinense]
MDPQAREQPLAGGVDHAGAVVRVEDTVRRPGGPAATQVRFFLTYLDDVGFTGAPRFHGLDEHDREILDYLDGQVAVPPFPDWAADEDLLISVALLQRELHRAAAGFRLPAGMHWPSRQLPPGAQGDLVCHTDLCLENVVVRDGHAAAFIDFDLATPAHPLFDIAIAARHWIPLRDPVDIADARASTDLIGRFRLLAGAHHLNAAQREQVISMLLGFLDNALRSTRWRAESGHPGFARMWADGYEGMNRRSRAWLTDHAHDLSNPGRHQPW